MSESTTNAPTTNANASKANKPPAKRTSKGSSKGYKVPDLARAYLAAKGVRAPSEKRVYDAGKTVRQFIRTNKGKLGKADPAIKRHTKGADYGVLNARTRDAVVKFAKGTYKSE